MEQPAIINLESLRAAPLSESPFPFVVIPNFLRAEYAESVARDFPDIKARGSFPLRQTAGGATFKQLADELSGDALRHAIAGKFALNLDDRHTLITVRGY